MNKKTLRASTVACVMALVASPAVADTVSINVTNDFGYITELYIDGASLEIYTINRVTGQNWNGNGESRIFVLDCDDTGRYNIYTPNPPMMVGRRNVTISVACGSSANYEISEQFR